jgi:hypothetical protein
MGDDYGYGYTCSHTYTYIAGGLSRGMGDGYG